MKIGIVGSGPIGRGYAALLVARGHEAWIWRPRGTGVDPAATELAIETVGIHEACVAVPLCLSPAVLGDMDAVIICVPGNGHRFAMEAIAPYLKNGQTVIISSHSSLSALYLSRLTAGHGVRPSILCWATTVTGGPMRGGRVHVRVLRSEIDVAAIPACALPAGLELCRRLFGDMFVPISDLLAISLSNLNPQIHMANSMLNFTRIERGEAWGNFDCITESVGRLIEALDLERLAIARAFGVGVRTVHEHYRKSYEALDENASVHQMAQAISARRGDTAPGPTTLQSRYLTEDLPFGVLTTVVLGKVVKIPTPLHEAGLAVLSAACGTDFSAHNDLLPQIGLESMDEKTLRTVALRGYPADGGAS